VNLVGACGPQRVTRSDIGLHDLKHLRKGIVERMTGVLGGYLHRLVPGMWWGSEILLEQVQLNFSFRNKFIIVLPCGLLVYSNIFSKMCIFKSLTG
jgi:hypothetical protein